MSERSFEIKVGGRSIELELGKCAVSLFRRKQEVDYLAVQDPDDEENVMRIFNNEDFVRWVAGYQIDVGEDGIERPTVYMENDNFDHPVTFRELTGWSPSVIEKENPLDWEEEMWLDVQMRDLDTGRPE